MGLRVVLVAAMLIVLSAAAKAEWRAIEQVKDYPISGSTGIALYQSVGTHGPKAGIGRAIAYTDFKLTWQRDYQPRGGGCVLASAVPKLIITYHLPAPSAPLPLATQKLWETFITGVKAHERVHGEIIVDMVKRIEAVSMGLAAENDPNCQKVRQKLQDQLPAIVQEQRQRHRDFDRVEMNEGGNVHRLVLKLVNG